MFHLSVIISEKRVEYIAPVVILPGEREMEALAEGSYKALKGEIPMRKFIPQQMAL